jgi:hypothetical protein
MHRNHVSIGILLCAFLSGALSALGQTATSSPTVEKLCSIQFDKDTKRPARVEDSALTCLNEAAQRLRDRPAVKLVLVGVLDLVKDHAADENGHMRETEDNTGYDVRLEDLAAYRSLNTKWYLTRWYGIAPVPATAGLATTAPTGVTSPEPGPQRSSNTAVDCTSIGEGNTASVDEMRAVFRAIAVDNDRIA